MIKSKRPTDFDNDRVSTSNYYNHLVWDIRHITFVKYLNMLAIVTCLKTLANHVETWYSAIIWILLLTMNSFGVYWQRKNIKMIEECKLNLIMDNL